MRITETMVTTTAGHGLQQTSRSLYDASRVAASGRQVSMPNDGPSRYAASVRLDGRIQCLESRSSAVSRVESDLTQAEGAFSSATELLTRARELATQMADGTWSASERAAAAKDVAGMRQSLVALANTQGERGYLFGGSATTQAPFTGTGTFVGNDTAVQVEIGDGELARANVSGVSAFSNPAGRDVFADLTALETALNNNDPAAARTCIGDIDQSHAQVVASRAEAGLRLERMRSARDACEIALGTTQTVKASETEGDVAQVLTDLTQAQGDYDRALAVTRQVLQRALPLSGS